MRIVSLAPSNTEILFELGAGDDVVATTSLCDFPGEAREKPGTGGWSEDLDVEKVERLEPDIALASDDLQNKIVEELENKDVNVVQVKPHTLEEVFDSIERIGRLVDQEEKARELVESMKSRLDELSISGKRVYCEEWTDPPMVSGNWIPELVEEINGEYFIEEGRSREFKLEELKKFNPEHIFLNVCGTGENISEKEVLERDEWQEITAVKEENVHVIDDALLNRPGPRLVEGARKIMEKIED